MKKIRILSDYCPAAKPNILTLIADNQGDIFIGMHEANKENETGVRLAASGTRHTPRVRKAFRELIEAYEVELLDPNCHPDLLALNEKPRDEPAPKGDKQRIPIRIHECMDCDQEIFAKVEREPKACPYCESSRIRPTLDDDAVLER